MMKRILSLILVTVLVFSTCFGLEITGTAAENGDFVVAAKDSGSVSFDRNYAKPGKAIKASINGQSSKYFFKWYLDNVQIDNFTDSYTPVEADLEKMLTVEVYNKDCTLAGKKSMLISELPVIYIEVDNRADITSKVTYKKAQMKIQGNDEFSDSSILYDGITEIKGRGNSTWQAAKKPYKLKLDSKADLFGMGKNKHWVLVSNPYDFSNLRNELSYDLSAATGLVAMKSVYVDLVLNGKVVGLYQLCEHVRIDSGRVDITNWDDVAEEAAKAIYKKNSDTMTKDERDELIDQMTADLSWTTSDTVTYKKKTYKVSSYYDYPGINGGYLFALDADKGDLTFKTDKGQNVVIDKPEGISADMKSYLKEYYNAFEAALYSNDYCTVYKGKTVRYTDFIDVDSFAKGIFVNELFENYDFAIKSMWMSIDTDGKIVYGPVWDMDQTTLFTYIKWSSGRTAWMKRMISDPVMMSKVRELYWQYRYTEIADMMKDGGKIDKLTEKICTAAEHNDIIWKTGFDFKSDINDLRGRLQLKIKWLDSQFFSLDSAIKSVISGADYEKSIKSSSVALSVSGTSLNADFSTKPSRVKIFADGTLIKDIKTPSASEKISLLSYTNSDVITVIAYDSSGKVTAGNYVTLKKYISSLSVTKKPTKTSFAAGGKLDLSGMEVTAVYSDGSKKTVTPNLTYTYAKNAVGFQYYSIGKVTEKIGNVNAVIMCSNANVELPLSISARENYAEVSEMIANMSDDFSNLTNFRYLFEAKIAYDALSKTAQSKVSNYSRLESTLKKFDSYAASSDYSVLGAYIDGLVKYNAWDNAVMIVKKSPTKIVLVNETGDTVTHSRSDGYAQSIKTVGNYEIWTFSQKLPSAQKYFDCRAAYTGSGSIYGKRLNFSELENSAKEIKRISGSRTVQSGSFPLIVEKSSSVESVTFSENGKALKAQKSETETGTKYTLTLTALGMHTLDVSYTADGVKKNYGSIKIFVRDDSQAKKHVFSISCSDDYKKTASVKVITETGVKEVSLSSGLKSVKLSSTAKNGFLIWNGSAEKEKEYSVSIDGAASGQTVESRLLGDVNKDGIINSYDALLVLNYTVGIKKPTADQSFRSDVNTDGTYNSFDALMILQISIGVIE